jgi:hypothetical protein
VQPPPLRPEQISPSAGALVRASMVARSSAVLMVVLAGLSTLLNVLHPLSSHFLISIVVLGHGVIEWRLARRLQVGDLRAPRGLALNQGILGVAILAYGAWRVHTFLPDEVLAILERPYLRPLIDALPPEELSRIADELPRLAVKAYAASGIGAAIGCWAVAIYYATRRKHVVALAANPVGNRNLPS